MDTDEQPLILHQHCWSLQLKSGEKIPLPPRGKKGVQPLWVTDVFLVDPENAVTLGAVAACVKTSAGNSRTCAHAALDGEALRGARETGGARRRGVML
jgi:hypothetical protein